MDACTWDHPGADPYRGRPIAAAVAAYNFPPHVQAELVRKVQRYESDGLLKISRDGIDAGPRGRAFDLRDMHYGRGMCRGEVTRTAWPAGRIETALLYCVGRDCIAIATICGNVARVDYTPLPGPEHTRRPEADLIYRTVPEPEPIWLAALAWIAGLLARFLGGRRRP